MKPNFWSGDDELTLQPLTDEIVKKAEEILQVKLPDAYINLLKTQNGGYIEYNAHPSSEKTSWADDHVSIDSIMGISLNENDSSILESTYYIQEWEMPENLVLLCGDGHTWIALDYRETSENPPIIFIDNEWEQIVQLAPNFATFLNGLTVWEHHEE
ncbi:SMI1 / KNR4 family protein [Bacillus manliponensis]|uniref:SMI1 / KNR4 family protein n=1 Tax=Bacillus manliponensis TaxID=574376 RepID=A0A073JTT6_9BACI|nr:SMI1/KNR4 family protein [Bacillus manliponensis]KEK18449.1 SMI1 / KNR4 family protein [Bacillus manliponensis]